MKDIPAQKSKGIVVLTSADPWNYALVNRIQEEFFVSGVVYEAIPFRKKLSMLFKRVKRVGIRSVAGQVFFLLFNALYLQGASQKKVQELFVDKDTSLPSILSLEVSDINAKEVQDFLRRRKPAAVVVCGTGILRSPLLSLADCFINIHTGITPKYRGVHGGFWAVYNRDVGNLGVTVHLVDRGVDTGGILYQERVPLQPRWDAFWTIPAKQHLLGIELLMRALRDVQQKKLKILPSSKTGSIQWYHPTIREYLTWKRIMRTLA